MPSSSGKRYAQVDEAGSDAHACLKDARKVAVQQERLRDGAAKHGQSDQIPVEGRLGVSGPVRGDKDEEAFEELRLGEGEAVLQEL